MERSPSFELLDDEFILEEIYGEVEFDFDLKDFHSDARNLLASFAKREVIKSALQKQYDKLAHLKKAASVTLENKKEGVRRTLSERRKNLSSDNFRATLDRKKAQLEETIQAPPFLRTSDKIAFTTGITVLCITEWVLLRRPDLMHLWYSFLIFPLLLARYFVYRKSKFTYFMLDFCYFVQILLLAYLYIFPTNVELFQVVFAASNGPLAVGIVMWRNSLVFHDLDKLTSVFIHMFPPLVTFCFRWYPPSNNPSLVCTDESCTMSLYHAFALTMGTYVFWQLLYLLQTEVIDKKRIANDCTIMTSARWMSEVKPHPIWMFFHKRGANPKFAVLYLVGVQFVYTLATLLPIIPVFSSFWLHCIYLSLMFVICVWNGANFYFEIFTETYSKRLQRFIKQAIERDSNNVANSEGMEDSPILPDSPLVVKKDQSPIVLAE